MPKLNAAEIHEKYEKYSQDELFDFSYMAPEEVQIPIDLPEPESLKGSTNKEKGARYELYISSLYRVRGYDVTPAAGSNDMGIDLLCRKDKNYVICVQCKYRTDKGVKVADIFQFYGAYKYYASQNMDKTVSGAFWTTQRIIKGTRMSHVAESLGIKLFSGILIPRDFRI